MGHLYSQENPIDWTIKIPKPKNRNKLQLCTFKASLSSIHALLDEITK